MRTLHRDIVGAFIFSKDNKLLLGKNIKGGVYADCWVVPGGGIEKDEAYLQALLREVKEEVGLDITAAKVELINHSRGQSLKTLRDTNETVIVDMDFYDYKVTLPYEADNAYIKTEDDFEHAEWFDIKDLSKLKLSTPTADTIKALGLIH